MTIAYVSSGANATGSTSLSIPYPASPSLGDLILCYIGSKSASSLDPITVTDFTFICWHRNSAGTVGANSGPTEFWIFYKISDGTETGNISVTLTGGNRASAKTTLYSKDASKTWDVSSFTTNTGSGTSTGTVVGTSDINLDVGDWIVSAATASRGNGGASGHAFSCPGVTFGTVTERIDAPNTSSPGVLLVGADAEITAGPSSDVPTYSWNYSTNPLGSIAGGMLRLREVSAAGSPRANLMLTGVGF